MIRILAFALFLVSFLLGCNRSEAPPDAASGSEEAAHKDEQEEGGHDEEGHVELTEQAATAAGISLAAVGPASIREELPLFGKVEANAERMRDVTARYPGIIQSVTKRVGESVRAGETLATVESNESLRTYPVTAPLAGVVTARNANTGETAGEAALFTISDLSTVWVQLSLFPKDVAKVRVGQAVRVRSVDAGNVADGAISYIAPLGQADSQTLSARVVVDNQDHRWAPGLYVTGEVALSEADVPIAVKSAALQDVEGRKVVFVLSGDGFKATPVEIGRSDGEYTEIRAGIAAGDRYAAANSFVLKSELGKGEAGHDH